MVTDTLRSSYSAFSTTVNFTVVVPLIPLVAEAVHQDEPLVVLAMLNVQFSLVVNEIDCSPLSVENDKPLVMILESIKISDFVSSGLGVGSI